MQKHLGLTEKMLAGVELLERGLQMYYEGAYFAALHLGGAADEVLGGYLSRHHYKSAFEEIRDLTLEIAKLQGANLEDISKRSISDLINYAKNRTKHLNSEGDDDIHFDPKSEAKDVLDRALSNHYALLNRYNALKETDLMRRFTADLVAKPARNYND